MGKRGERSSEWLLCVFSGLHGRRGTVEHWTTKGVIIRELIFAFLCNCCTWSHLFIDLSSVSVCVVDFVDWIKVLREVLVFVSSSFFF